MIYMKTIKYLIAFALFIMLGTSCQDNENWRIIPYEPEPSVPIEGPEFLLVVGNHQSWNPGAEVIGKVYPVDADGNYEGYAYLDGEFKFTSQNNWDGPNYGSGDAEGSLSTDAQAGNLTKDKGYYYITVNIKDLTYKADLRNFGVIGSATSGGWNEDIDLVYDPNDLKLKVTTTLTDGEIKFRANDAWDVDFGAGEKEGELAAKGGNIPVSAGDYQIVVDLSNPSYTYELIKQ